MKTKLRLPNEDPRGVNRTLFGAPWNPSLNFALEDPLLLMSHPAVQKEGLSYTKYFCGNSPLSSKASEFIQKKFFIEKLFSDMAGVEKTLILPATTSTLEAIADAYLPSQVFFVPDSMLSPFPIEQTNYFSHSDPSSLLSLLTSKKSNHLPIVFMPKICPIYGKVDFTLFKEIKEKSPFFFILEDRHTFGLEGLKGFAKKSDTDTLDLLITHIPKAFGKMLTLLSGEKNFLDTLFEHSFSSTSLFPPAAYLGMFNASLSIIESMQGRRDALASFSEKLSYTFSENTSIHSPLLTFHLDAPEEKTIFTKSLVDKGFLLPASFFKENNNKLTLHINHLLEETSIHSLYKIKSGFTEQTICEGI